MAVELVSQESGVLVNRTRVAEALSRLLDNSRSTISRVEALVTLAAALLFLQLILATWKRRQHNSIVSGALSVCTSSLPPLVFYTLSIMQSSPVKNSVYPVWGAVLLMSADGMNVGSNVEYDSMQLLTVMGRYLFYFVMFSSLLSPYSFKEAWKPWRLYGSTSSTCIACLLMSIAVTKAFQNLGVYKDRLLLTRRNANNLQYATIDGDKLYPFGYAISCLPRPKVELITVDQIWDCCWRCNLDFHLADVCFSLAFCQHTLRRYLGFPSAQARLPTIHHLIFNDLLQMEKYERIFSIIEMELGFCYDFFFTKYHDINIVMVVYFLLFLWRVTSLTSVLVYTVQGSVTISTTDPIIQVQITRTDNIITLVLLGTALVVELLQALVYLASDWIKISLACLYVKHKPNAFLKKMISFFSRPAIFSRRRNRIAQHTVIMSDRWFSKCNFVHVQISLNIYKAIARSIKPTFGEQTNRPASQVRNSMFEHWALKDHWTLKDHTQVEIMLIWHIATDYCHYIPHNGDIDSFRIRLVAVKLSRYCAYLLAFLPKLIPYNEADINELTNMVKKEIPEDLSFSRVASERYQIMKELGDGPPTVFRKGVKLGKQLEGMLDEAQRWKAMEDFWAKTIIYIAPSHITAKEHMRQLENGGEFLTHIWALLSHAGILNLVRDDDEIATPAQAQPTQDQETV